MIDLLTSISIFRSMIKSEANWARKGERGERMGMNIGANVVANTVSCSSVHIVVR